MNYKIMTNEVLRADVCHRGQKAGDSTVAFSVLGELANKSRLLSNLRRSVTNSAENALIAALIINESPFMINSN